MCADVLRSGYAKTSLMVGADAEHVATSGVRGTPKEAHHNGLSGVSRLQYALVFHCWCIIPLHGEVTKSDCLVLTMGASVAGTNNDQDSKFPSF